MENKNLLTLAITLTVGIILAGSLLMPVLSEYTTAEITYTNEGTPYAVFDGETHTMVVSIDDSNVITITTDGESCELPTGYNNNATIVYGEDGYARLALTSGNLRVFVSDSANSLTATASNPVTLTIESTGITMTKGTTTYTATCTPLAYLAASGDYVLGTSPYAAPTDTIYLAGTTNYTGGNYVGYVAYGTVDDLIATTTLSQPSADTSITIADVEAVANTTVAVAEISKINSVVFTATLSDDSTLTGTFSYFLAPKTVKCADPNYVGNGNAAILGAIPIMVIVALVMMAAGALYLKRDD